MDLKTYLNQEKGTAQKLAAVLAVSKSYLSQLASGKAALSAQRCVEIEEATNGAVTRRDLRPTDFHRIWPELRDAPKPKDEPTAESAAA